VPLLREGLSKRPSNQQFIIDDEDLQGFN
jgi:hypothetical protein